ncbi:hypothetical protein CKALI_06540 [Corynebacterium kalinowskii]|uniref:Uncharacterized protein n=1 Tax=Corynebacterium kalinowskii TaxID=2675216 RepID=A0A6B8VXY3_9CORY|nr:hypothetical protein [Corynebacterium kalinowskii]QGU02170.1 hypothetical protein CKALI_06540 [Corynebacterium kalinowskii]
MAQTEVDYDSYASEMHAIVDAQPTDWVSGFATWIVDNDIAFSDMLNLAAGVCWYARSKNNSAVDIVQRRELTNAEPGLRGFTIIYCYLQSARFDFDYRKIRQAIGILDEVPKEYHAIVSAFRLFADLAKGEKVRVEDIEKVIAESDHPKILHLLIHGMWLSPLGAYGDKLVDISTQLIRLDPKDSNAWMRRAEGHRRLGEYEKAIDSIDTAIAALPAKEVVIHGDYVRERGNILTQKNSLYVLNQKMTTMREELEAQGAQQIAQVEAMIAAHTKSLEAQYRDMLFRIMEILALFVSLIALLAVIIGSSIAGGVSVQGRVAIILSGSIFVIFFFMMVHILARPKVQKVQFVSQKGLEK